MVETAKRPPEATQGEKDAEQELKAELAQFTLTFLKALMMSGIYPPDHPAVVDVAKEPYEHLKNLEQHATEITYQAASSGAYDDITVEGVLSEGVPFLTLIQSSMSEHFAKKFIAYFERNHLVSFAVKPRMEKAEFLRLIAVFVERRTREEEQGLPQAYPFSELLLEKQIVHASAMTREEIVGGDRPLPWRVKMAISRLRKDLRTVPYYSEATKQELAAAKTMIIQDITRPLRKPQFLKDLLANTDLISSGLDELATMDLEREITWCLHPGMLTAVSWEIVADLDRASWGEIRQAGTGGERRLDKVFRDILKGIAMRLREVEPAMTRDLLRYLFRKKALGFKDLPYVLQQELVVEKWTEQFLSASDAAVKRFADIKEPAVYKQYIATFVQIFPELIKRGRFADCKGIAELVREHVDTRVALLPERQDHARAAMARMTEPPVLEALAAALDREDKDERAQVLQCMVELGDRTLAHLLRVLAASRIAQVRRDIAASIEKFGEDAHVPLMEMLGTHGYEWYVYRNLVMLLGKLGCVAAADDVRRFLSHPHARVREEAIGALERLQGPAAIQHMLPLARDRERSVAKRAISVLSRLKCRHTSFLETLAGVVAPGREEPVPDDLLLVALDAVARVGAFDLGKGDIRETLLQRVEGGTGMLSKLLKKKAKQQDSEVVRSAVCATLGITGDVETARRMECLLEDTSPLVRERAAEAIRAIASRARRG